MESDRFRGVRLQAEDAAEHWLVAWRKKFPTPPREVEIELGAERWASVYADEDARAAFLEAFKADVVGALSKGEEA